MYDKFYYFKIEFEITIFLFIIYVNYIHTYLNFLELNIIN